MSPFAIWIERAVRSLVYGEPRLGLAIRRRRVKRAYHSQHQHRCRGFETLEERALLAVDMGQISGTVFSDLTGDGQTGDDLLLSGVTVHLYEDGGDVTYSSGNGSAGGDDTLLATTTTSGMGEYVFDGLVAGTYFVEQIAPSGWIQRAGEDHQTVTISLAAAEGTTGITIDDFASSQVVNASSAGPTSDASVLDDASVLGGERDMYVEVTSGSGTADFEADFVGSGVLNVSSSVGASVLAHVTWDGDDDDATSLDATGLGGLDLTDASGNPMTSFELEYRVDHDEQLILYAYSSSANWSQAVFNISDTAGSIEPIEVDFADFVTGGGTGASFTDIGALRLQIGSGTLAVDAEVSLVGTVGPTVFDADFANYEPLSLGDLVWNDANNDGDYDAGSETGIGGVTVNLYEDSDGDGNYTDGTDTLFDSVVTDGSGNYLFENIIPGDYIVQIAESNFNPGNVLEGTSSSSGNDPAPDPDDDVDNDDNGSALAGFGVVSEAVTLAVATEPVDDGDTNDNTNLSVDFGFLPEIDLEVTKTDNPDPVIAGNQLVYTITVTNHGPSAATGVIFTDTLPAEVTYVGATSSHGTASHAGGVVTVNIGTLANGAAATVTITVTVGPGTTGMIDNSATVVANENDVNPVNDTDVESTVVTPEIDLAITKMDSPDPVAPNGTLTYTLAVTNNGPSNATGVTIQDTLPAGVTFVSAVPSQGTASEAGGVVTVDLGAMAVAATANVTVQVTIDSSTSGTINNVAVVTANETDTNAANDTATEPTVVTPELDLAITKDDSRDPVAPGDSFNYTLTITNNGPSNATGVVVTDILPSQVVFVSATPSQGTASHAGGVVTANLGNLASGVSATVSIAVTAGATASGTLSNMAQVTANETETSAANNTATETTTIQVDPASLAGSVYVDSDDDGIYDAGEIPIPGVVIALSGTDYTGAAVSRSALTAADGAYLFSNLLPGTYTVQETQPGLFPDGQDTIGSAGGTVTNDTMTGIVLGSGDSGTAYNFGELPPTLSKRNFLASGGP